jgi:hypothetical protein
LALGAEQKIALEMKQYLFAAAFGILGLASCSKDDDTNTNNPGNNSGKATVSMRLTDGPADYDAVYLDIQQVEVTMEGSSAVMLTPIRPGQYDILRFRNGLDTLLLRTEVPAGKVGQIRLILGNNNYVVVNGVSHQLTTPSGQTSGIKLNLQETFMAGGAYTIWIDFDAAKSIHQTGNGKYMLKPVIRAYSATTDGRIKGYVLPLAAGTTVYAINGVDTFAAIPDPVDGFFRITGLPQGSYQVWYDAQLGTYSDVWKNNVQVTYGQETNLDVVTLLP